MSDTILAIDTSMDYCSVAVYKKKKYIQYQKNVKKNILKKFYL
ncbi:hypothetical protein [Buchnera aphidicola]